MTFDQINNTMEKKMAIIIAQLKYNIALENLAAIDKNDWTARKVATDKVNRAKCELQAARLGLR